MGTRVHKTYPEAPIEGRDALPLDTQNMLDWLYAIDGQAAISAMALRTIIRQPTDAISSGTFDPTPALKVFAQNEPPYNRFAFQEMSRSELLRTQLEAYLHATLKTATNGVYNTEKANEFIKKQRREEIKTIMRQIAQVATCVALTDVPKNALGGKTVYEVRTERRGAIEGIIFSPEPTTRQNTMFASTTRQIRTDQAQRRR